MSINGVMGRLKQTDNGRADRHKPRKMIAIRKQFHEPAEELRIKLGCDDLTELANIALRELLERHNLWPPKDGE